MIRRIIYLLLATIVFGGLAGLIAFYAFDFKPKMIAQIITSAPRPPVTIAAEDAKTETWQPLIAGIGTLQATEGIDITPQVSGTVQKINFDSGVLVKKGDILVQLDTATDEADLRSLEAQLVNAEADLPRNSKVFEKGYAARASLDAAQALRDQLAANKERVEAQMKLKTVVAPWDGRVGLRSISVGSFVAPGQKITWLQKTDDIFADFAVTETDFGRIKVGQKVHARFASWPDQVYDGEVVTADARVSDDCTDRATHVRQNSLGACARYIEHPVCQAGRAKHVANVESVGAYFDTCAADGADTGADSARSDVQRPQKAC